MKIKTSIILIAILSISLIFGHPLYSNAEDESSNIDISIDGIISAGNSFLNIGETDSVPSVVEPDELQKLSNAVSNVLLTIALVITVISAVVMGINFAVQSVEDKAKIKEAMIPWIIGIFVSFGAYGIWRITMGVFYGLS